MICNMNKTHLAADEIDSIGTSFAAKYYDALVGKPNASALRHFYTDRSTFVYGQSGRPDCVMQGLLVIGRFFNRMRYGNSSITIRSVTTTRRSANLAEFTVSSVCDITRPGNATPRTFTQSAVITRVPWTTDDFRIVRTDFKYDDDVVDYSIPIAVGGVPEVSSAISTGTSGKPVERKVHRSVKKSTAKITKVNSAPVDRHRISINGPEKKPRTTARLTPAGTGVSDKKARGQLNRVDKKPVSGTAQKIFARPIVTETRRVTKNTLKDESAKPEARTTVKRTVGAEGQKDFKRTTSVRPALVEKRQFVSSNRYGHLAILDDQDCPVKQDPINLPSASQQDATNESKSRSKRRRRNRKKNGGKHNNGSYEVEVAEPKYLYVQQL